MPKYRYSTECNEIEEEFDKARFYVLRWQTLLEDCELTEEECHKYLALSLINHSNTIFNELYYGGQLNLERIEAKGFNEKDYLSSTQKQEVKTSYDFIIEAFRKNERMNKNEN